MIVRFFLLGILLVSGLCGRLAAQEEQKQTGHQKVIVFGSGGGFSGMFEEYTLHRNGKLFYYNTFTRESRELPSIGRKQARRLHREFIRLKLDHMELHESGNMNWFIRRIYGSSTHELSWSSESATGTVTPQLSMYYDKLMGIVKDPGISIE